MSDSEDENEVPQGPNHSLLSTATDDIIVVYDTAQQPEQQEEEEEVSDTDESEEPIEEYDSDDSELSEGTTMELLNEMLLELQHFQPADLWQYDQVEEDSSEDSDE